MVKLQLPPAVLGRTRTYAHLTGPNQVWKVKTNFPEVVLVLLNFKGWKEIIWVKGKRAFLVVVVVGKPRTYQGHVAFTLKFFEKKNL